MSPDTFRPPARAFAVRPLVLSLLVAGVAVVASAEVVVRPAAPGAMPRPRPVTKVEVPTSSLLLPFFLVDTEDPGGITTLFAVRNESEGEVLASIRYYRTDRVLTDPLATQAISLGGKEVLTINLRDKVGPLHLPIDADGFARGYVAISSETNDAVLQGDTIFVDTTQAFAQGDRLIDTGAASAQNGLCQRYETRYLNGGGFTGTVVRFWVDALEPPSDEVPLVVFYTVYDEAGTAQVSSTINSSTVAFEVPVQQIVNVGPITGPPFGVIEFEFDGTVGHVSTVMNAAGLYSVGFAGACLDDLVSPP